MSRDPWAPACNFTAAGVLVPAATQVVRERRRVEELEAENAELRQRIGALEAALMDRLPSP